ncbi:MAG: hypothetical protein M1438_08645 [Deltaproteobacteria bacterium]|nr:hypothetical protein [Deltaproteobacteria bacterium]
MDRQRLHHRGVQAEEPVFEFEFVLRAMSQAAPVYQGKQRPKKGGGTLVIERSFMNQTN